MPSKVLALIRCINCCFVHVLHVWAPSKEQWKSRFFDLKRAYRQCAVNPMSAPFAHIAVFDPTTSTTFAFRMKALRFGSVKSVHSFLRVAHSLWAILVKEFAVAWTNYFDDFVTFAKADEVASVTGSIKFVFKLLVSSQVASPGSPSMWLSSVHIACVASTLTIL